jgi:hypothetical protein
MDYILATLIVNLRLATTEERLFILTELEPWLVAMAWVRIRQGNLLGIPDECEHVIGCCGWSPLGFGRTGPVSGPVDASNASNYQR